MRSPEALKPRETHRTPDWPGAELSMETIRAYLADLSGRGRRKGTVQMYSAKLRALYDYLPPDKQISRGTLAAWRAFLLEAGYSPSTVNTHLSAANGLMEYMGRRDLQLVGQLEADKGLQPELSRVEYLRLLQAARILEKERTYLLVKIFALAGIRVGELPLSADQAVHLHRIAGPRAGTGDSGGGGRGGPAPPGGGDAPAPARLPPEGAAGLRPAAGPDGGAGVLHPERERHEPDPGDGGDPDPVS